MARVTSPAHSADAKGKLENIVYARWKQTDYVRSYVAENKSKSVAQLKARGYFATAAQAWLSETSQIKTAWSAYVAEKKLNMTGYNLYIKKYIEFLIGSNGVAPTHTTTPPTIS